MKTKLPADREAYCNDDVRQYARERGWPLPDVFLVEFEEAFQLNGRRHEDWELVMKRWLRTSSPQGQFYNARFWELKLQESKVLERKQFRQAKLDFEMTPPQAEEFLIREQIATEPTPEVKAVLSQFLGREFGK